MTDDTSSIEKAGADVFRLEPRVALENDLGSVAGGQHPKDMLHGEAMPADDWLAIK